MEHFTHFLAAHPGLTVPYAHNVQTALQFVYLMRSTGMEGADGLGGRITSMLIWQDPDSLDPYCYHCRDRYEQLQVTNLLDHTVYREGVIPSGILRSLQRTLLHGGIWELSSLPRGITTAPITDVIGIRTTPEKEHWYMVVGRLHTDPRHNRIILPSIERALSVPPVETEEG